MSVQPLLAQRRHTQPRTNVLKTAIYGVNALSSQIVEVFRRKLELGRKHIFF